MQVTINGEPQALDSIVTIQQLIEILALDFRKVAIERNLQIVPKSAYSEVQVADGDTLEIVQFIGGG